MKSRLDGLTEDSSSFMQGVTGIRLTWKLQIEVTRNGDPKPEIAEFGPMVFQTQYMSDASIKDAGMDIIAYSVETMLFKTGALIKEMFRQQYAGAIADKVRLLRMQWSYKRGVR